MLVIYTSPILVWTNKVSPMICQTSTIRTVPIVVWNHCWDVWWNGRRASNSKWAPIAMFQNTLKKPLILLWIDTHPRGNESMLFHRFWHNSIKIYWFHQNISWYLHFQHRWLAHSCIWGNNRREIAWTEEKKTETRSAHQQKWCTRDSGDDKNPHQHQFPACHMTPLTWFFDHLRCVLQKSYQCLGWHWSHG